MPPPIERFVQKFRVLENGCWEWLAGRHNNGYAVMGSGRQHVGDKHHRIYAHRFSYEYFTGHTIQHTIDHLCRNRACVNPDHLQDVPLKQNILRGVSPPAQNAHKTTCPAGHPYNEENTHRDRWGYRHCRVCDRIRHRIGATTKEQ